MTKTMNLHIYFLDQVLIPESWDGNEVTIPMKSKQHLEQKCLRERHRLLIYVFSKL